MHPQATQTHGPNAASKPSEWTPDVLEYGAPINGARQTSNRRLFMQLLVYTGCQNLQKVQDALSASGVECVLYTNALDPYGFGVLFMGEDASLFPGAVRTLLNQTAFSPLTLVPEMTMFGRTYALGYEPNLDDWLMKKPRRTVFDEKLNWVVWYPLRRKPEFETLSKEEQRPILMEHAKIGMAYGQADLAYDVRLACHGLDTHDNEFVIGVLAKELHPISHLIHEMRKTQQTSKHIQSLGPFFVGHAAGRYNSTL